MDTRKILNKSLHLILKEGYNVKRCAKKFGCSPEWLKRELYNLNNPELTIMLDTLYGVETSKAENTKKYEEALKKQNESQGVPETNKSSVNHRDTYEVPPIDGLIIKKWRTINGYSQQTLGKTIGCHGSMLSRMERNMPNISKVYYDELFKFAGLTCEEMINKYKDADIKKTKIYDSGSAKDVTHGPTRKKDILEAYHRSERNLEKLKETSEKRVQELESELKIWKENHNKLQKAYQSKTGNADTFTESEKMIALNNENIELHKFNRKLTDENVSLRNELDRVMKMKKEVVEIVKEVPVSNETQVVIKPNPELEAKLEKYKTVADTLLNMPMTVTDANSREVIETLKGIVKKLL